MLKESLNLYGGLFEHYVGKKYTLKLIDQTQKRILKIGGPKLIIFISLALKLKLLRKSLNKS